MSDSVLNIGKSAKPPLLNDPEVVINEIIREIINDLDDAGISLPDLPYRTNLKLHNASVTLKMIKKVITNLDLSKASVFDCMLVVLTNCDPELSYILTELFNECLEESCFPDCWKVSLVVKICRPVSFLSVVNIISEKLVHNRIVDHLDFQFGFGSAQSTSDFLTVVSDRLVRAFNRPRATQGVPVDISKTFDKVWHACLLYKLTSHGI